MKAFRKAVVAGVLIASVTVAVGAPASAHVVVKPAEAVTASFQTFTVGVPNEKDIPTTSIKVLIPEGVKHVSPTQKAGWKISVQTSGEGDTEATTSITWNNGTIIKGMRDDFTFSGQVPAKETDLQWKAYQTYSDGTVVAWDQASEGGHGSSEKTAGPFSVTKVVTQTAQESALKQAEQTAINAKNSAATALYVGLAGLLVGLASIFLGTRKK
jgi:uncharacterized protein YcnI